MIGRWRAIEPWVVWGGMLLLVAVVLIYVRDAGDQTFRSLPFLLVVLGGSASGGRRLGFALATAAFLILDYYLQPPYNRFLHFRDFGDFTALATFLVTAATASSLLENFRRERDQALRRSEEVASLSRERERLLDEAQKASALREAERIRDFVLASVSHDLRTPLTTIKMLAQEEQRTGVSHASDIEEQTDRLTDLVADLLDLSRLRSGSFSVSTELNSAEDVVGAAIRQCQGLINGRRVTAAVDETAPALYGCFDFLLTLRILVNLLENALRHSSLDGEVEVAIRRHGAMLVFSVADRGAGVAEAERKRIFEPFYRPEGSPPDRGRAGLGLAISRALAESQSGSVSYQAREGGGSMFELRVPAADLNPLTLEVS